MNEFWIVSAVLCIVAVMFIVMPLLFSKKIHQEALAHDAKARTKQNIKIFKERMRELYADQKAGVITEQEYEALKIELEQTLLEDATSVDDSPGHGSDGVPATNKGNSSSIPSPIKFGLPVLAVVMVAASYILYDAWGYSDQVEAYLESRFNDEELAQAHRAAEAGDTRALLTQLHAKLSKNPNNVEGWSLLARTAMSTQQYDLAIQAYQQLLVLEERELHAALYGLLAQAFYFSGRPLEQSDTKKAIESALKLDPSEQNSLGLLAIASFEQQDWQKAIDYWALILQTHPDHPSRSSIELGIKRAKQMLGEAADSNNNHAISVNVSVSDRLMSELSESAALFVFAKAAGGPPMPLAVRKITRIKREQSVQLSDADAMTPALRLSQFEDVLVSAKLSMSGDVMAQSEVYETEVQEVTVAEGGVIQLQLDLAK